MNTLIVGATGGIGEALARVLPKPQILVARDARKLFSLAQELGVFAVPADVTNELELQALALEVQDVQTLVYAVGDVALAPLEGFSVADATRIWQANVLGFQLVCKHLGSRLLPNARVYAIGARPELVTYPGFAAYASAKAALAVSCRIAELELKRSVTLVLPPAVNTAFWQRLGKPVPRNAVQPETIAAGILEDLARMPSAELRIG